jgi:hypothetical protein
MGAASRLGIALLVIAGTMAWAASAQAASTTWSSVKVQKISPGVPWTEPRITTGPDGTLWVVTNGEGPSDTAGGEENTAPAVVLYSTDNGNTWHKTDTDFAGQTQATPDVDIVTLPSGRVIASELDTAGINFPSAVSDDRGKTWQQATGSNTLADQDRQWLAQGPVPGTGKTRVYLLFHNLASGNANHNMFVAPSDDGGKTFGVPVPITLPGDDAYSDLQCADSGGPGTIFVNQRDGTVYAEFTTRGTPIQGVGDTGGCTTLAAGQPLEFNIVAGTRVWLAQSKDGGQTWTKSLPVDDAATGQIVSMQLAYSGLDTAGNIYVTYPESPNGRTYPDYSGAGVKYTWARPAASAANLKWAPPKTFAPADPNAPGHVLVHMTAGDPGQLMGEYWEGVSRPDKAPAWYLTAAQTNDAFADNPTVTTTRISNVAADTGTASELMGACTNVPGIAGIINGLGCGRSPDVWGITTDASCKTHIVWPAVDVTPGAAADPEHAASDSDPATWVSNQTGGPTLCESGPAQRAAALASGSSARGSCPDRLAPVTRFKRKRDRLSRRRATLRGTSRDRGCKSATLIVPRKGVAKVDVSLALVRGRGKGVNCRFVKKNGRLAARYTNCRRPILLHATGKRSWKFTHRLNVPAGNYRVVARGTDIYRNKERPTKGRNITHFRVR